jgi:uncharacterized OB-fold protein
MFSWFGKVSFVPYSKVADFAVHLKDGRIMGSRCQKCGFQTFPPRADCPECRSGDFEFVEYSGKGKIFTFSTISAVPTGFDDMGEYTCIVVELEEGGRCMAWLGESLSVSDLTVGMEVQVVPQIFGEIEEIKLYLSVEEPGTTWGKAPA